MDRLHSQKIWDIANALRLPPNGSPADAILAHCVERAGAMLADFPDCATPSDLLEIMAATLGTSFELVRSDDELLALQKRYVQGGEFGFASLDKELHGNVYGVTYRRMAARTGERPFVSVIDCRGDKALRSYFTKWHEIGHLLNHVVHYGRWWNPAVESQATDRAYRIGQTKDVSVYLPILRDPSGRVAPSFDERLDVLMNRKQRLAEDFLRPLPPEDEMGGELLGDLRAEAGLGI